MVAGGIQLPELEDMGIASELVEDHVVDMNFGKEQEGVVGVFGVEDMVGTETVCWEAVVDRWQIEVYVVDNVGKMSGLLVDTGNAIGKEVS